MTARSKTPKATFPKPFRDFEIPLYRGRVCVFKTRRAVEQARTYFGINPFGPDLNHLAGLAQRLRDTENGNATYLVGWFTGSMATLCHELNHVAFFELDRVGIDPRNDAGEAFCFLQSALLRACGVT